jgi:hypothetical protein
MLCGCMNDTDCNDNNVCTTDSCVAGQCKHIDNYNQCDDGEFYFILFFSHISSNCSDLSFASLIIILGVYCNGIDSCAAGYCSVHGYLLFSFSFCCCFLL